MENFIKVNTSLLNTSRLLAVRHKPLEDEGSFRSAEHYLAVFDTGKELWLSPEEGLALMAIYQDVPSKPPDGMMATTSEMEI